MCELTVAVIFENLCQVPEDDWFCPHCLPMHAAAKSGRCVKGAEEVVRPRSSGKKRKGGSKEEEEEPAVARGGQENEATQETQQLTQ